MTFHPDSLPDLTGKVYIVTGGNSGIGYYTVAHLAEHGAHVYLCARSQEKGNAAVTSIQTLYPQAHITLLEIDHLSLSSVVSAAKLFFSKETVLHGLVNNAGIMATPFKMTSDGFETQWQTNYLAHWHGKDSTSRERSYRQPIIIRTLLNTKRRNKLPDTSLKDSSPMTRYGQSKLANVLHVKTLQKVHGPNSANSKAGIGEIWIAAVHPGLVKTNLGENKEGFPAWLKIAGRVATAIGQAVDGDTGSWTSVFCVASPEMRKEQSGTYFQRIADAGWQSGMAKDMVLAGKLEDWTTKEMKNGGWVE